MPSPGKAVTRLAFRQVRLGAVAVAVVAAGMSAAVAAGFRSLADGGLDNEAISALADSAAVRTLFGEPLALADLGGFTVWRTGTSLALLLAVWGLVATTRITRGEENDGAWDLLLAGRSTLAAVVVRKLLAPVTAAAIAGAMAAAALAAMGTGIAGALLHGLGLTLIGMFFAVVAGLAAQIFPTRTGATTATIGVLGGTLLMRMIGDGVPALAWLRWPSPFGLVALSRPFASDDILPLLVLAAVTIALGCATVAAASRRDLRQGMLRARTSRPARLSLLGSVSAFAMRRSLRMWAAWALGVGAFNLLIGLLAPAMNRFLTDNPRFAGMAAQAGFPGLDGISGYTATLFALLAIPLGAYAAVRASALITDERGRRLILIYARPVTRLRMLTSETAVTAVGMILLASIAGTALWAGARSTGTGLGIEEALGGAWNTLPVATLSLGAAVLAIGWAPHATALAAMAPTAGGFILKVLADTLAAPDWIVAISPFAHLAAVPYQPFDPVATGVLLTISFGFALAGSAGYRRRDLLG